MLRDERPEWNVRELTRIVSERAGIAIDSTADPGAEPGFDVAVDGPAEVAEPAATRERVP
jgi:hypothetical protein